MKTARGLFVNFPLSVAVGCLCAVYGVPEPVVYFGVIPWMMGVFVFAFIYAAKQDELAAAEMTARVEELKRQADAARAGNSVAIQRQEANMW